MKMNAIHLRIAEEREPLAEIRPFSVSSNDSGRPASKVRITQYDLDKDEVLTAIHALKDAMKSDLDSVRKEIHKVKQQIPSTLEKKLNKVTEELTLNIAHCHRPWQT